MIRRPPRSTRTDTLFPYTTLFRSLILVDDASHDGSPAIMAEAAARDPRVRLLHLDTNVGLPAALNHGFAAARGELHSWTSDDNLLRPAMLARLVAALDARPDADIVHAAFLLIDAAGNQIDRKSTRLNYRH